MKRAIRKWKLEAERLARLNASDYIVASAIARRIELHDELNGSDIKTMAEIFKQEKAKYGF